MLRYGEYATSYDLYSVFSTDHRFECIGNVHGYIKLNEQAFWAQEYRCDEPDTDIKEKAKRLCLLAANYPYLTKNDIDEFLTKPPVILIIGESYEHCRELNNILSNTMPEIRKLFTYDTLLNDDSVSNDYFEFVNNEAFALNLQELI